MVKFSIFPASYLLLHTYRLISHIQRYDLLEIIPPFSKYYTVCPPCLQSFFCSGFADHLHVRQ